MRADVGHHHLLHRGGAGIGEAQRLYAGQRRAIGDRADAGFRADIARVVDARGDAGHRHRRADRKQNGDIAGAVATEGGDAASKKSAQASLGEIDLLHGATMTPNS